MKAKISLHIQTESMDIVAYLHMLIRPSVPTDQQ